ncbi:MAG: hypothetical protein WCS85_00820 [Candidatus Peribacteraceae bacterium]|jgi:glucose-6-phosphate-specific signal transduction histidine kinase
MRTHSFPQFLTHLPQDIPAIHAGLLVFGAILATLCNPGVFALLLAATISLDVAAALREERTVSAAIGRACRDLLLDVTLFAVILTVSLYYRLPPPFLDRRGMRFVLWTIGGAVALAVPKIVLLYRFARRVLHPLHPWLRSRTKGVNGGEIIWLFLLVVSALLIGLSILLFGYSTWMELVMKMLMSWRF